MTSAGVPAPRSMTSASVPAPAPRSMASAGVAPSAPGRSMPSAGAPNVCVPEAPARRALPMAPAGPVHRPPPVSPMQPSQGARATPLPTSAQDPVWASQGTPPPRPRPASAVAVLSSSVQGAVHGTASPASAAGSGSPPPFRATPTPAGGGALPPRGASAFHSAPSSGPAASSPSTPPSSAPLVRLHAEVRRLGPNALAFRLTPQSRWVLFSSRSPIQVRRVDTLEEALRETRDFSLDITVEEPERLDVDSLH